MQFSVGDKVLFGRGNGEKTLAEVTKVNRASIKVKTLESRGTQRNYPVGTVWKVHPSLCQPVNGTAQPTPVTSTRARQDTPRQLLEAKGIKTGDIVELTFKRSTMQGRISRINSKSVTVVDVTDSRYPRGVYCNPRHISHKVGAAPKHDMTLRVGVSVGYDVRGKPYTGVVTKVNRSAGTYEVYGGGPRSLYGGGTQTLPAANVTAISKRSDKDIIDNCSSVYGGLSPENLWMDGEASRSHVRRRSAILNRALKALFIEIGREVTENEVYGN